MNRAADVAIAGVGLALTSPLIGLAALATKLEDRGPVLYRQPVSARTARTSRC